MITIARSSVNAVTVTTTEKGSAAHYLFAFYSEAKKTYVYCVCDDTSPFPDRYNQFSIQEMASPNPLLGQVEMKPTGQWYYFIYANSSATNLNPAGLTLLERGMCIVTDSVANTPTFTAGNTTAYVYEP